MTAQGRGRPLPMPSCTLIPCELDAKPNGERVYIDPSYGWPARRAVSVPHVRGNATRRRPDRECVEVALSMRPAVGLPV